MPARIVRSEINASDSLSRVSMFADLTFRALIVAVDDYGRIDGRIPVLRGLLFPLRPEVTDRKLNAWLDELAAGNDPPIIRYEVDGRPFVALSGWERHRGKSNRAKESKCPEPASGRLRENPSDPPVLRRPLYDARESTREGDRPEPPAEVAASPPTRAPDPDPIPSVPKDRKKPRPRRAPLPNPLTVQDREHIRQRSREFSVDPDALEQALCDWAYGGGYEYVDWGRQLGVMLRGRWRWTEPLFATNGQPRRDDRESPAQAKQRRINEAAREAFRQMTGEDPPSLLALPGGRS